MEDSENSVQVLLLARVDRHAQKDIQKAALFMSVAQRDILESPPHSPSTALYERKKQI